MQTVSVSIFDVPQNIKKQHREFKAQKTTYLNLDDVRVKLEYENTVDHFLIEKTPEKQMIPHNVVCQENIKEIRRNIRRIMF